MFAFGWPRPAEVYAVASSVQVCPVKRGVPRQLGHPPAVGGDVVDLGAHRVGVGREQQHLGDGGELGLEALLQRLRPHGGEVGRQRHVGEEVVAVALELRDHRRVVGQPVGVRRRQVEGVARALGDRREHGAERVAVGVVRERRGDDVVVAVLLADPVPHRDEALDQVLGAEEVHDGPLGLERRLRRGLPPRLTYHDSHGMLEQISGVPRVSACGGDRVDRLRGGGGEQQVHVVVLDGLLGQRARPWSRSTGCRTT